MAGSAAPRALSASGFVPPADLILAQHDEDDAARERRQAVNQGQLLLDRLEGIRLAILSGRLSRAEIEALARAVSQPRQMRADPALASLLDEIALRAAVEIAKLEQVEKTRY